MDADKVVIHHVESDRVGVVLDLLRECVRQPCEPAHVHPQREVRPLHVGRADVLRIGRAFDLGLLDAGAFGGAVSALKSVRRVPVRSAPQRTDQDGRQSPAFGKR